jgi:hypothetical protein
MVRLLTPLSYDGDTRFAVAVECKCKHRAAVQRHATHGDVAHVINTSPMSLTLMYTVQSVSAMTILSTAEQATPQRYSSGPTTT